MTLKKKKTCILSIFHIVSYSYGKIHANHSVWRNKMTNRNMSFQCFCHQNAKMYGNHAIMKNKTTLPKMYLLSVFVLLTYLNAETHPKHPVWGKRITLLKTCIISAQELMSKKCQNACKLSYMGTKRYYKKHISASQSLSYRSA